MNRTEILTEATRLTTGDRQAEYGEPWRVYGVVAQMMQAYLNGRRRAGDAEITITAEDVLNIMALVKIGRIATGKVKADSYIDLAGYAALAWEVATDDKVAVKTPEVEKHFGTDEYGREVVFSVPVYSGEVATLEGGNG